MVRVVIEDRDIRLIPGFIDSPRPPKGFRSCPGIRLEAEQDVDRGKEKSTKCSSAILTIAGSI